jgi:hypothetical protein
MRKHRIFKDIEIHIKFPQSRGREKIGQEKMPVMVMTDAAVQRFAAKVPQNAHIFASSHRARKS